MYTSDEAPERGKRGRGEGLVDLARAGHLHDVVASVGGEGFPPAEDLFEAERAVVAEGVAGGGEPGPVGVGGRVEAAEHDEHLCSVPARTKDDEEAEGRAAGAGAVGGQAGAEVAGEDEKEAGLWVGRWRISLGCGGTVCMEGRKERKERREGAVEKEERRGCRERQEKRLRREKRRGGLRSR